MDRDPDGDTSLSPLGHSVVVRTLDPSPSGTVSQFIEVEVLLFLMLSYLGPSRDLVRRRRRFPGRSFPTSGV